MFGEHGTSTPGHFPVEASGRVECKKFVPYLLAQIALFSYSVTLTGFISETRPEGQT